MPPRWIVIAACRLGASACRLGASVCLLGASVCLLGASACKKDDPPAPEPTAEERRRQECERFATEMARTGLIAGQVLVTALDDDPDSAARGRDEMKQNARQIGRELLDKCLRWPDDVMECLPPLGILKDGCEEKLLAAMDGATPSPEHVPPGPAPAWSLALPGAPRHVAVASDGMVLVVVSGGLVGVRDGQIAWRDEGDFAPWLVPLPGQPATWVAGVDDRVVGLDPTTGSERWEARLPPVAPTPADEDDGNEDDGDDDGNEGEDDGGDDDDALAERPAKARVRQVAWHAGGLLVGDAEARFFRVDPAGCAATAKTAKTAKHAVEHAPCVAPDGRIPDEVLEDDARLLVDGRGRRYLWETGVVRAFSDDWRTLMTARAHDMLSHVTVTDERLVLIVDAEVVELDPTQCRGEAPFAPSEWPQPGVMFARGSDECSDCATPPPGCRRTRTFLRDVTGEAPALMRDGAVVVHHDGYTLALHEGAPRWKVSTGGGGPLATDGTRVLGFSTGLREGDPPGVLELGATDGALRWHSVLPFAVGDLYFGDDIHLALGGTWLAVAYEETLVAIPLPPA